MHGQIIMNVGNALYTIHTYIHTNVQTTSMIIAPRQPDYLDPILRLIYTYTCMYRAYYTQVLCSMLGSVAEVSFMSRRVSVCGSNAYATSCFDWKSLTRLQGKPGKVHVYRGRHNNRENIYRELKYIFG